MITIEKKSVNTRIIKDLRNRNRVVNDDKPKGYLTGEEFVSECKSFITDYYKKNGLL